MYLALLIFLTLAELALMAVAIFFYKRLKQSEQLIHTLYENQDALLMRLYKNTELERDLVATFTQRQEQLHSLNATMDNRIQTLQKLLQQAEGISRSPRFLRELILNAQKKGQSLAEIAASTGLAKDEIELILSRQNDSIMR